VWFEYKCETQDLRLLVTMRQMLKTRRGLLHFFYTAYRDRCSFTTNESESAN